MKKVFIPIIAVAVLLLSYFVVAYERADHYNNETEQSNINQNLQIEEGSIEIEGDVLDYFYEIALGSEYGSYSQTIRKWVKDEIRIATNGTYGESDDACLDKTIEDFNSLSKHTKLSRAKADPDIAIHFASEDSFKNILKEYVATNMGFFWTWSNEHDILYKATILIDTSVVSEAERCHLIREELTQSLGFMNDSPRLIDSIFYTDWTHTAAYSKIDKAIISILYGDNGVSPGMNRAEVEELFTRKRNNA